MCDGILSSHVLFVCIRMIFRLKGFWFSKFHFARSNRGEPTNYFPINNIGVTLIVANKNRILVHTNQFLLGSCSWVQLQSGRQSARTIHVGFYLSFSLLRGKRKTHTQKRTFFSFYLFVVVVFFSPVCLFAYSR